MFGNRCTYGAVLYAECHCVKIPFRGKKKKDLRESVGSVWSCLSVLQYSVHFAGIKLSIPSVLSLCEFGSFPIGFYSNPCYVF